MRLRAVLLSVAIMALAAPGFSQTPLIADLSEHQIQITTGFVGTDVLLFGTVAADSHVVVVVRGPEAAAAVWRKARYAGIWVNDQRVVRSEEHTSELQSLMRISYAVFCLNKKI